MNLKTISPEQARKDKLDLSKDYRSILLNLMTIQTLIKESSYIADMLIEFAGLSMDEIQDLDKTIERYTEQVKKDANKDIQDDI